jgi:hypothetical protein
MTVININKNAPHFMLAAMCLACNKRWIALVIAKTSLFHLECPECHAENSFATFMPQAYLEEIT